MFARGEASERDRELHWKRGGAERCDGTSKQISEVELHTHHAVPFVGQFVLVQSCPGRARVAYAPRRWVFRRADRRR